MLGCGQCLNCFVSGRACAMDLCVDWVLFVSYGARNVEKRGCCSERPGVSLCLLLEQSVLNTSLKPKSELRKIADTHTRPNSSSGS